ncbi:LUD domain-containing protein [Mariniluteicoccus endophyticus]
MTSSREKVLARVREALADVPADAEVEVPWTYGQPTGVSDVLGLFVERVEDYRAVVERVPADGLGAAVAAALDMYGTKSIVAPPDLPDDVRQCIEDAGVRIVHDDPPLSARDLDAVGGVVTDSSVGIAETGTIVLDHGPGQGRRAISLVPDVHVCVVRGEDVVTDVPEAMARLAPAVRDGRPLTWISGPSATSDIELDRVEGVHGPRKLHVLLVEPA